jgi:hypothetical protein
MYQEREAVLRIRSLIDSNEPSPEDEPNESPWNGPRVQFGSPDRQGRQLATEFVKQHVQCDPGARQMELHLRTFLYQRVRGYGDRIHFRRSDLPTIDGMLVRLHIGVILLRLLTYLYQQVLVYQLATVGYESMLDSRSGLDVMRVTDSWRKQGPRRDYALADEGKGLFVVQLLKLFVLKARGRSHSIIYVRRLQILRRGQTTGYIELFDKDVRNFIFADAIVRSCVVLSPGIDCQKHVLWDMEGSDMYIRLQDLS